VCVLKYGWSFICIYVTMKVLLRYCIFSTRELKMASKKHKIAKKYIKPQNKQKHQNRTLEYCLTYCITNRELLKN